MITDPEESVDCALPSSLVNNTGHTNTIDPTVFLAGLIIKCLWIELATMLWQGHLDFIHKKHLTVESPIMVASIQQL